MSLFRIHAYEITPQRTQTTKTAPIGGALPKSKPLASSLASLYSFSGLSRQAAVDFKVSAKAARQHDVRDLVMDFTFGSAQKARASAITLATRLADFMDDRSPPSLLLLTVEKFNPSRRMTIWAFPQEEAFRFNSSGPSPQIQLLKDIFSRSSRLRKAATFQGAKRKTDFWSGQVLDLQAAILKASANYWIEAFLDCRFGLEGKAGTRLLANHLRSAYEAAPTQHDRDQIYNAMVAVRTSPKTTWSAKSFATQYLQGEAKRLFEQSVPTDMRTLQFTFDRSEFENKLNFRVFQLDTNVYVSAPFGAIGHSVKLSDGTQRTLKCEGVVVEEKVRARHG